jgi:hypothetical protein
MLFGGAGRVRLHIGNAPRWRGRLQFILATAAAAVYITVGASGLSSGIGVRLNIPGQAAADAVVCCQFGEAGFSSLLELRRGARERIDEGAGKTAERPNTLAFEFSSARIGPS